MTDHQDHIQQLGELIKDARIAMFTTVSAQGRLVSRPLGTQEVAFDGDLWFATGRDSGKVEEIQADPRVCVAYANPSKNTYVSVSGAASIVTDRARIDDLWSPAMKIFFPDGKDDPNLVLIRVDAETAEYWDGPGTFLGKVLYLATAAVTGNPGAMSDNERIDLR